MNLAVNGQESQKSFNVSPAQYSSEAASHVQGSNHHEAPIIKLDRAALPRVCRDPLVL